MAQRLNRLQSVLVVAALAAPLAIPACWDSDGLGPLFGAPDTGGDGGFDPGVGGGLQLRDLFVNARLLRDAPTIVSTAPATGATNVSLKTAIVIEFSESMTEGTVRTGLSLFQSGSSTATAVTTTLFQGDSVAVMVPQSDLLPNTDYEIVVAGPVSDLQGDAIERSGGAADSRFRFKTIQSNGDPDFEVIYSSPKQQSGEVPRGSEALIVFSEPVNVTATAGGLNGAGNLLTRRDGAALVEGVDYTVTTFPTANPRGALISYSARAAADADVEVVIDKDVQSADGQESLKGGEGFTLEFTTQDTAIPESLAFPASPLVPGVDGAISSVTLHAFEAEATLTADGQLPDTATIVYFDVGAQNALLFSKSATAPTLFVSDLEPQATPALQDGTVIVGVYVERRGFRSEVSVLGELEKDTVGPRLVEMGDPNLNPSTLITQVNDPVLHGRMTEPCAGFQVDFDGAGTPDFNSVEFVDGQSTVSQQLFVTGPSEDAALPAQLEPKQAFSVITSDIYGNASINADTVLHQTVGMVGASLATADTVNALHVVGFSGDLFQPFTSGAVLIDAYPPDANGAGQIARALSTGNGVARFSEAELAAIPTAQITVTILAKRTSGATTALFGPITFGGVDKPTTASPRAILALLAPEPVIKLTNDVQCDLIGESQNSPSESGSAFVDDLVAATIEQEKQVALVTAPGLSDNVFDLPLQRLHCFSAIERVSAGGASLFRFSTSEPFLAADDAGQVGFSKSRAVDYTGQSTTYSEASHPALVHQVTFADADVSAGGSVGLLGTEAGNDQLRELRMLCRLPGFVSSVAVGSTTVFTAAGGDRIGRVLLPLPFTQNDSPGTTGFADSPLELLLQPGLIDDAVAVDAARLRRNLRLELVIGEKGSALASGASTRQRFLIDPAAATASVAAPQAIPVLSVTDPNHAPELQWTETTSGEGMHCLSLISLLNVQVWRIYVPAGAGPTVTMRVPQLPSVLPDAVGTTDFSLPSTFQCYVESFDFDPTGAFSPGSTEQYHFDPQRWWQSDLEREFLNASRSDPLRTITTQ
ncbi:MAG: Ig-like domain-containing protein [Planctomycetes bacterium]|nr:Ig-like domain-containing protein [Planctomycetota bacterium]